MKWRRKQRVIYSCGNCRETFKSEDELRAHRRPVCPLVAIERQLRAWNESALRALGMSEDIPL